MLGFGYVSCEESYDVKNHCDVIGKFGFVKYLYRWGWFKFPIMCLIKCLAWNECLVKMKYIFGKAKMA